MAGIFFCLHTLGFFSVTFKHRLEFFCEINSGDQRWVNVNINKDQNCKGPLNDGGAALGVCLSVSSVVVGETDASETGVSVSVSLFLLLDLLSLMSLPAFIPWRLALWQGCIEGEDLGTSRAAERSGECSGLHSSSLRIVCRMLSQKYDNLSVQKGKRWHGGRYTAHACPSSRSLSLTLLFSSGWHPELSTPFRPFRVISTSDHTEDKNHIPRDLMENGKKKK